MTAGEELRHLITKHRWKPTILAMHMGVYNNAVYNALKSDRIPPWKMRAYAYAIQNDQLEKVTKETFTRWKGSIKELSELVGLTPTDTRRTMNGKMKLSNFRSYAFLYAITRAEGKQYDY